MNKIIKISLPIIVFVLFFAVNGFALDKYYLLRNGNIARDDGQIEEAIKFYQEYIESHPTTSGVYSNQYHKRIQYYIRNLLIAYSNLFDIYRENGQSDAIDNWIKKLKDAYSISNFGSKNMYSLAMIYFDNNLSVDATDLCEQIIKEQEVNYNSYNNKVTLRAYSKLLKIYESQGEDEKVAGLIESLRLDYPVFDFDLKDKYKLSNLYLKYGLKANGEKLLKEIIDEDGSEPDYSNINVLIKTYSKLLKIGHKKKDKASIKYLMEQISRNCPIETLSHSNIYKLAVTYLKCGEKEEGTKLLIEITNKYSDTTFGRKALFLLGRVSQSNEDWDSAIKYYTDYVERYPEPPFFALKAYSRLIDSYWSRDANIEIVQDETNKLCDIINNVSDFETQLNLARDLKWKGMDELSSATFSLGLSAAKEFISENENTYKALRAHWMIEKYAYALDRFDLVEESGSSILEIINASEDVFMEPDKGEKKEYIKSQTYLWLAKVYEKKKDYYGAIKFLKKFMETYPKHKEINYARYELGLVYEGAKQAEEAVDMYKMVEDSMWKKKAEKRLSILGF